MAAEAGPPDAYSTALRLLGIRDLSEQQLRQRLARRRCDADDVERALGRLREQGYLDDRRVADAVARTQTAVHQRGRQRVMRQIQQAGVSSDTARQAVARAFDGIDEDALATAALDRRLRGRPIEDDRTMQRLYRYLTAQGFDHSRALRVLRARRAHGVTDADDA